MNPFILPDEDVSALLSALKAAGMLLPQGEVPPYESWRFWMGAKRAFRVVERYDLESRASALSDHYFGLGQKTEMEGGRS